MDRERVLHPIPPVFDENSGILILGSFPSVYSRNVGFFYGNPQNRFWKVLAAVFGGEEPVGTERRRAFLLENRVALWDVVASCELCGSSDSSIRNVRANDIPSLVRHCGIRAIYANGKTAFGLYQRYVEPSLGVAAVCLPSTSPANAAWSLDRLTEAWSVIKPPPEP